MKRTARWSSSALKKRRGKGRSKRKRRCSPTFAHSLANTSRAPEGGTPWQRKCWEGLLDIPYGETRTYGYLASFAGNACAARAAGGACHANPILILIPCHRVIGKNGSLTGFGAGMDAKERLLALEKAGLS